MIVINLSADKRIQEVLAIHGDLDKRIKASKAALQGIKPFLTKKVLESFTIKRSSFEAGRTKIKTYVRGTAVDITGRRIGLAHFKHSPTHVVGGKTSGGVTASVEKGSSRNYPHAFVKSNNSSIGVGIYRRKGKERYPIKQLRGASVAEMATSRRVKDPVSDKMVQQYIDSILEGI